MRLIPCRAIVMCVGALVVVAAGAGGLIAARQSGAGNAQQARDAAPPARESTSLETATFAAGCFWCSEALFERVQGVEKVVSGYAGGTVANPTYQQVCTGQTGHAEAVQITFDPTKISYADLLEIFWKTHDPTTLNQQGPDHGTQYRSAIFYHNEQQKKTAEDYKRQLDESKVFKKPIVTEITAFTNFYPAEQYHQDYYELNPRERYCKAYISPKIKKFNQMFRDKLKKDEPKRSGESAPSGTDRRP